MAMRVALGIRWALPTLYWWLPVAQGGYSWGRRGGGGVPALVPLHALHTGAKSTLKGGGIGRAAGIPDVGNKESAETETATDPLLAFLMVSTARSIMARFKHIASGILSV